MLRYLFRAYFADDDVMIAHMVDVAAWAYEQTQADAPRYADHGSAFTDVTWLQEHGNQLLTFALVDAGTMQPTACVHLATGHFELGGHEFYAGADGLDDPTIERRLIYYRQVRQVREQEVFTATGESVSDWRYSTHTRYYIGWQATIGGRNVQHVIGLDG